MGGPFNGPLSLWKVTFSPTPHIPNAKGTSKTYGEPGPLQALGPQTNRILVLPFWRDSWERLTCAVTSPQKRLNGSHTGLVTPHPVLFLLLPYPLQDSPLSAQDSPFPRCPLPHQRRQL